MPPQLSLNHIGLHWPFKTPSIPLKWSGFQQSCQNFWDKYIEKTWPRNVFLFSQLSPERADQWLVYTSTYKQPPPHPPVTRSVPLRCNVPISRQQYIYIFIWQLVVRQDDGVQLGRVGCLHQDVGSVVCFTVRQPWPVFWSYQDHVWILFQILHTIILIWNVSLGPAFWSNLQALAKWQAGEFVS